MSIRIKWNNGVIILGNRRNQNGSDYRFALWFNLASNNCNLEVSGRKRNAKNDVLITEFTLKELEKWSEFSEAGIKTFIKSSRGKQIHRYSKIPVAMSSIMNQQAYRLIHLYESDSLKSFRAYALITDLLAGFLEQYGRSITVKNVHVRNEYDKERIVYARDYLITHLDSPPSLSELASIVGINEYKLKNGFKEIFNNSPYAYLAEVRLEMARTALINKQKNITQIAFELGYASPQHFSAAFKKRFGVPPLRFN